MKQLLSAALVTAVAAAGGLTHAVQPQERALYVSVLDRQGAPVTGLGPDDVVVREDGMRREVLRVEPAGQPMDIALLVDNTQAATPSIQDLRLALPRFVKAMAGPHQLAFITFAERPTVEVSYSNSPEVVLAGVERLFARPGSGAYLLDAIVETCEGFRKRDSARPVIVVAMTEGVEFSNIHHQKVLDSLAETGAALHVFLVPPTPGDLQSDEVRQRNIVIDRGTKDTGGRRDNLVTSLALGDALDKLSAELRAQYLVTYVRPPSLIPPKKTEVEAARSELTARGTAVRVPRSSSGGR